MPKKSVVVRYEWIIAEMQTLQNFFIQNTYVLQQKTFPPEHEQSSGIFFGPRRILPIEATAKFY